MRESALVFGWLTAILLLITLLSYSPDDPAWSFIGGDGDNNVGDIHNRLGVVGAHIADILLSAFGYSAYLLCLIALLALHAIIYPLARTDVDRLGGHWCAVGLLIFILSSAALENIRFTAYAHALPSGAGGGIGVLIAKSMLELFGTIGACLILLFFWMISWSLAANLSWFAFFELVGEMVERIIGAIFTKIGRLQTGLYAKRARQQRDEEMIPPRTEPQFNLSSSVHVAVPPAPVRINPPPATSAFGGVHGGDNKVEDLHGADSPRAPLPSLALLDVYESAVGGGISAEILAQNSQLIEDTLRSFGVAVKVLATHPGPVITRYDIQPDVGVKGAQIVSLVRDMARALSVSGIRVLETIPGKNCMGLEIPNQHRATVYLSDLIADDSYVHGGHILPLAIGKDATGKPLTADLTKMPHLLVAGATGSGKSVCINAMLLSLLFALPPERLRLILIDPKMLELASYHNIPHLLAQVITDVSLAPAALNWAVEEMENRYRLMSAVGARNIDSYNQKLAAAAAPDNRPLPYIVIVIDELADLMMTSGKKVEITICRLTQKARAAGIHLILATQRPSVDVITGLIKANVPCRIAFQVASKVDSRTIIDQMGADMLLGMGDMLYLPPGMGVPQRVHGAFVDDDEVRRVAEHLRAGQQSEDLLDFAVAAVAEGGNGDVNSEEDALYEQAVAAIMASNRPSISLVQRKLRIGYNRAARLIESMESAGIVSPIDEAGTRKILVRRPTD